MRRGSGRPSRGGGGFHRGFGRGYDRGGSGNGRGVSEPHNRGGGGRGSVGSMRPTDPRDRARITGGRDQGQGLDSDAPGPGASRYEYNERERPAWLGRDHQNMGRSMGQYASADKMSGSGMPAVPVAVSMPRSSNYQHPQAQDRQDFGRFRDETLSAPMPMSTKRDSFDPRSDRRSQPSYDFGQSRPSDRYVDIPSGQERSRYPHEGYASSGGNRNEADRYRREQEDYFRASRGRPSSDGLALETKSPSESSPEYFSTNYPTTELDEDFEKGRRYDRNQRGRHQDYGEDEFEYDEPEVKSDEKPDAELSDVSSSDEKVKRSPPSRGEHDLQSSDRSSNESHSRREQDDCNYLTHERGERRQESNLDPSVARNSPSGNMERSQGRRGDEREPQSNYIEDGRGSSREEDHLRHGDERSSSSSLKRDLPDAHQNNSEGSNDQRTSQQNQNAMTLPSPQDPQLSLVITVTNEQCKNEEQQDPSSLTIDRRGPSVPVVKGAAERLGPPAKAPADRLGPPTKDAVDRLGPPAKDVVDRLGPPAKDAIDRLGPPAKDAIDRLGPPAKDAIDRLGPPAKDAIDRLGPQTTTVSTAHILKPALKSALKMSSRKASPKDEDFDLYADIPPPESEDVPTSTSDRKEELIITLRQQQANKNPPVTERFPYVGNISQSASSVAQASNSDGGSALQGSEQQAQSDTTSLNPGRTEASTVSVVTIPKSKWESDEEEADKHILLVPKTDQPKPETPLGKAPKKRDQSLHVGQIVKDIRYNNPNKSKVQELIGEGKAQKNENSGNSSDDSTKRRSKSGKKKKKGRDRRSRSRSRSNSRSRSRSRSRDRKRDKRRSSRKDDRRRSRSDSRHRDRRRSRSDSRDRRRSRSDSRDRDRNRDRHRLQSSYRGRQFNRGRGWGRGRGRGYFDNRYDNRDDHWRHDHRRRSRSRSRSRGRKRSRGDRYTYSSSRSRSRSSSYSRTSSSRSSSRSSYSSRSSSRSRSRSKDRDTKKKSRQDVKAKGAGDNKKERPKIVEEKDVKDSEKQALEETVEKEYDIFSGEHITKQQVNVSEEEAPAIKTSFATVGGLSDPLGLKQLTKPITVKNKVYSGPIHDMPQLTVKASSASAAIPSNVPLASAKPLKSILKKKKLETEEVENEPKQEEGSTAAPSNLESAGIAQLTSILEKLVPQGSQPSTQTLASLVAALTTQQPQPTPVLQHQEQVQHQFQQMQQPQYQQQRDNLGLFSGQGGNAIPGLGNESNFSLGSNVASFLAGNPNASIPGLDTGIPDQSAHHPTHGGGISTFSATGFGGLSSATVASGLPSSFPGLTDATNSLYQATVPQSNLNVSSLLQQSGLKMTPELSAALSGVRKQQPQLQEQQNQSMYANMGLLDASVGLQKSSYHQTPNDPFLAGNQMGQTSAAVEEEDRFLYGEQGHGYQEQLPSSQTWQTQQTGYQSQGQAPYSSQAKSVGQEQYIPTPKLPTTQAQSVDSNQVQKILSAIGFDFEMAKKVAQEKEKTKSQLGSTSRQSDIDSIQNYVQAQRAESNQNPDAMSLAGTSTPAEYKLEGLNQTASFLVTGLQVTGEEGSKIAVKAGKKKKKKDKSEKKKAKKEKLAQKEKQKEAALHAKAKKSHDESDQSKSLSQSAKSGSKSPLTEPISDDDLQEDPPKKHSQYPDMENIKIQVEQKQSSTDQEPNRRIVLLPQEQGMSHQYGNEQAYGPGVQMSKGQPSDNWHMQQQYSKANYYWQQDWEAKERKRIEESLRTEFLERESAEKERRRKAMLKKEQEWLMREVALKTMEEKIRREEEKLLREKDARKREEYRRMESERARDSERKWRLKREKEDIQKNLMNLERDLASLKKQQGDIMRRKQHQKDGHKDPQLLKNTEMQDQICEEIRRWRKLYSTVGEKPDREDDRGRRESVEGRDKRSRDKSSERPSRQSPVKDQTREDYEKESKSHSSRHDKRSSFNENQESKARFKFTYFDDGNHWCRPCHKSLRNLNELFMHLHSKKHMKLVDPMDRPWLPSEVKQEKTVDEENRLRAPIKGGEFMMPVNGFYCRLCYMFIGDGICGSEHMKDPYHNIAYQKFVDENKQYEKQLDLEKAASGSTTPSDQSKAEEEEENKGTKRKVEDEGDEKEGKHAKKDVADVKISSKQPGGFGVFEFDKPKEEKMPAQTSTPVPPPLELRKDSGQKLGEAKKEQQQPKLSIKLGSKRLIPSALLKMGNQTASSTGATTANTTVATTAASLETASKGRTLRSSTSAQRPLPMIGKRPTRRSKEEVKESAEPVVESKTSLEQFLQGAGGKAVPVISDKKVEEMDEEKQKKEKESSDFVLTENDIASAFKGMVADVTSEGMELQVIDACEDSEEEQEEIPAVPGSEDVSGVPSNLPRPIPPPPPSE